MNHMKSAKNIIFVIRPRTEDRAKYRQPNQALLALRRGSEAEYMADTPWLNPISPLPPEGEFAEKELFFPPPNHTGDLQEARLGWGSSVTDSHRRSHAGNPGKEYLDPTDLDADDKEHSPSWQCCSPGPAAAAIPRENKGGEPTPNNGRGASLGLSPTTPTTNGASLGQSPIPRMNDGAPLSFFHQQKNSGGASDLKYKLVLNDYEDTSNDGAPLSFLNNAQQKNSRIAGDSKHKLVLNDYEDTSNDGAPLSFLNNAQQKNSRIAGDSKHKLVLNDYEDTSNAASTKAKEQAAKEQAAKEQKAKEQAAKEQKAKELKEKEKEKEKEKIANKAFSNPESMFRPDFVRRNGQIATMSKEITIRNDSQGGGGYGARRGERSHKGIDIEVTGGDPVLSPYNGKITKISDAYTDDTIYKVITIRPDGATNDKTVIKIMYVQPNKEMKIGDRVKSGDVIGNAQKISDKYSKGMIDHLHIEMWVATKNPNWDGQKKDEYIENNMDPTSYFLGKK